MNDNVHRTASINANEQPKWSFVFVFPSETVTSARRL